MRFSLLLICFLLCSCSTSTFKNNENLGDRSISSLSGAYLNCSSVIKSFFKIKKAKFVEKLKYADDPSKIFQIDENSEQLMKYVNSKRVEDNFYFGKEVFYSIDEGPFRLSESGGRSFSGDSYIKKGFLYLEVGGALSTSSNNKLAVDILNSLVLASMMAKDNFSHLKGVRIVGKQIVNEKLAGLLHRLGFSPVVEKEGYDQIPFSQYFSKILNSKEDEQLVNDLGESIVDTIEESDLYNDLFIDLVFK